jgi:hypothetical protein
MDILNLARTGLTVRQLTNEDIVSIFGRLEMSAAAEAMRKAQFARDQKAAIVAAITHLEAAEAASRERVKTQNNFNILGIDFMSKDAVFRAHEVRYHWFVLFCIYVTMATLYYVIGEMELAVDALKKLQEATESWAKFRDNVEWTPGHYLNPGNWRYLMKKLPISVEELEEFGEIVSTWEEDYEAI